MEPLRVFLDEGALDGAARFPSACAVIVGDLASATDQIENLIHDLLLKPAFRLEPGASRFEEVGFHHVEDNLLAKERFKELLPRLDFEWLCSTDLDAGANDPYTTLPDQFQWVVGRVLQKYRGKNVHFVFEQNDRLQVSFRPIVEAAVAATGTAVGLATFSIGTKHDRILSVADYCIALASQALKIWVESCCDNDNLSKRHPYRSFAEIEPSCSILFAANFEKSVSKRAKRLADHSFFEVSGFHSASCPKVGGP